MGLKLPRDVEQRCLELAGQCVMAKGRTEAPQRMNKLEAAYAHLLDGHIVARYVARHWFGAIKLRLADKTWYAPDFLVLTTNGLLEFHEVKGFMRDDAAVKLKVAAELYPLFTFRLVRRVKGAWDIRTVEKTT